VRAGAGILGKNLPGPKRAYRSEYQAACEPEVPLLEVGNPVAIVDDRGRIAGHSEVSHRDVKITCPAPVPEKIMIRFHKGFHVLPLIRLRPGANQRYSQFHGLPYLNSCRSFTYGVPAHSNEVPYN